MVDAVRVTKLFYYTDSVVPIPKGTTFRVRVAGTTASTRLYSNAAKTLLSRDGISVTLDDGLVDFWVLPGRFYDIEAFSGGRTLGGIYAVDPEGAMADPGDPPDALVVPPASESTSGIVRLATQSEVNTGTNATKAVTPLTLDTKLDAALAGITSVAEVYVQPAAPASTGEPLIWVQTGLPGGGVSLWFDDGT